MVICRRVGVLGCRDGQLEVGDLDMQARDRLAKSINGIVSQRTDININLASDLVAWSRPVTGTRGSRIRGHALAGRLEVDARLGSLPSLTASATFFPRPSDGISITTGVSLKLTLRKSCWEVSHCSTRKSQTGPESETAFPENLKDSESTLASIRQRVEATSASVILPSSLSLVHDGGWGLVAVRTVVVM